MDMEQTEEGPGMSQRDMLNIQCQRAYSSVKQNDFDAKMREALRLTHKDREALIRAQDSYGINRAERIKSWEMAAERMQPTPEPARRVHTGLATVAAMDHRAWGWGA